MQKEPIIISSKQAIAPKTDVGGGMTEGPLFEKGQTYSLEDVLLKLSERAHKHDLKQTVINNCNCNCTTSGIQCGAWVSSYSNCNCDCASSH